LERRTKHWLILKTLKRNLVLVSLPLALRERFKGNLERKPKKDNICSLALKERFKNLERKPKKDNIC